MRAWMAAVGVLAACGSPQESTDGSVGGDASELDAPLAPDAAPTHGVVTVHLVAGSPLPDELVVFVDDQQTQVLLTDADGNAATDVRAGASVTWVRGEPPLYSRGLFVAVLDTRPGDILTLGTSAASAPLDFVELAFAPVPARPDLTYIEQDACSFGNGGRDQIPFQKSPIPLRNLDGGCALDPMPLSVYAHDPTNKIIGGYHAVAAYVPHETVTLGAFEAFSTQTATVANLGTATAGVIRTSIDGLTTEASEGPPGAWTNLGPAIPSRVAVNAFEPTLQSGQQFLTDVDDGSVTALSYDGAAQLLPWLGAPVFDPATRTIAVPSVAAGTSGDVPDYAFAFATYQHDDAFYNWEVYAPSAEAVVLPEMPPDLAAINSSPGDTPLFVGASTFEVATLAGYRAVLASDELLSDDFSRRPGVRRTCRSEVGP